MIHVVLTGDDVARINALLAQADSIMEPRQSLMRVIEAMMILTNGLYVEVELEAPLAKAIEERTE